MRYLIGLAVAVLLGTGVWAFFYFDTAIAFLLGAAIIIVRRLFGKALFNSCLALSPEIFRHWYEHMVARVNHAVVRDMRVMYELWVRSKLLLRFFLVVAGLISAALMLVLLIVVPRVVAVPFRVWTHEIGYPYLVKTALFKGLEAHLPLAWHQIPNQFRQRIHHPYTVAWWRSARALVATRQKMGKSAHALTHRQIKLESDRFF